LSLHDALPILGSGSSLLAGSAAGAAAFRPDETLDCFIDDSRLIVAHARRHPKAILAVPRFIGIRAHDTSSRDLHGHLAVPRSPQVREPTLVGLGPVPQRAVLRSEERRVGKEWRTPVFDYNHLNSE